MNDPDLGQQVCGEVVGKMKDAINVSANTGGGGLGGMDPGNYKGGGAQLAEALDAPAHVPTKLCVLA